MINTTLLYKLAANTENKDNQQPPGDMAGISPAGLFAGGGTLLATAYGGDGLMRHMKSKYPTSDEASLANVLVENFAKSPKLQNLSKYAPHVALDSSSLAGFLGSARSSDPETQKRYDRAGKAVAGIGTLWGLANAVNNAHTAYKGTEIIGKGTRSFLERYNKLPADLALAAMPAATYYGARYLPGKINKLYNKLTNNNQQENSQY